MFKNRLQWRLVTFIVITSICLIVPIGVFLNNRIDTYYYDQFIEDINSGFSQLESDQYSLAKTDEIYESLNSTYLAFFKMDNSNKSITVIDRTTSYMKSNDDLFEEEGAIAYYKDISNSVNFITAMAGKEGISNKLVSYKNSVYVDYAKPIDDNVLYFRFYRDEWKEMVSDFNNILLTSLLIALAVALGIGLIMARTVTSPINKLMKSAESIAGGSFGEQLEVKSNDEIGKLAEAFNHMSKNLKIMLDEISSEKNKIQTIIDNMTEGIMAYNLKGELIHLNPRARRILKNVHYEKDFNRLALIHNLNITISKVLKKTQEGETISITRNLYGKTIKFHFEKFSDREGNPEGIIMVLIDITEDEKTEIMRREFVANVSHELKTPLTSVKSYTETLLDGALDEKELSRKFLKVIDEETDRMSKLVSQLLQLSRLDNNAENWNVFNVDIPELMQKAVDKLKRVSDSKRQKVEVVSVGFIPEIEGDYDRLQQVATNLIGNAIKYTEDEGIIKIHIRKIAEGLNIKISDNGIGIPEEDVARIFERFYRVDKARSRKMGGTGLGLAISKEIIEAHGGIINIKSREGKGTEVSFTLPLKQEKKLKGNKNEENNS